MEEKATRVNSAEEMFEAMDGITKQRKHYLEIVKEYLTRKPRIPYYETSYEDRWENPYEYLKPLDEEDMADLLNPDGQLAVITFHSLEDRIVKQTLRRMANPCTCPPKIPMCICGKKPIVKVLGGGGVKPSKEEIAVNARSRSAMLRGCAKL
jgi:hypothetical protein